MEGSDRDNEHGNSPATGAKLESFAINPCELDLKGHHLNPSTCWDEDINHQVGSAEEKVFFLLAGPIRGFKY